MENLAVLTMSETQFKNLISNGALLETKYTVKILPDDSELKDNETYQNAKKVYRKARETKENLAFNLLTNK